MTPTHISVAIVMVAVTAVLFLWFQRSLAAGSARRMTRMLRRFGLDPGIATRGDPRTEAIMKEARRRCGNCRLEDFCNRWLTGDCEGANAFCPNARVFHGLASNSGRSG